MLIKLDLYVSSQGTSSSASRIVRHFLGKLHTSSTVFIIEIFRETKLKNLKVRNVDLVDPHMNLVDPHVKSVDPHVMWTQWIHM